MTTTKPSALLRILGLGFGVAIIVGNAIGSGILRMPGEIASYLTNEWLIISLWVLAGGLSLLGALIYAEAGTAYPYAGGPYVISEKVFGKQAGFTVGICDWVLNIAGNASLAIAGAEYLNVAGGWNFPVPVVASGIVVFLSAIQWLGLQLSSVIQQALSFLKAGGLLLLVAVFFMHGREANVPAMQVKQPVVFFGAIILAFRAIMFTYASWNAPIYFSEETTEPKENLPKSLIYGVLSLTIIYVLVNAAILYLLPASAIAGSPLAVAEGAFIVFGETGKWIVTAISIIIVSSSLYAGILYTPRILFGIARSGLFFQFAATLNRYQIPGMALVATTLVTIAFVASGSFKFIISVYTFLYLVIDTSMYVAALYSRWKNKAELSFKAPAFPILHLFMILANVALLTSVFGEDVKTSAYAVAIILSTIPLYYLFKAMASKQT